MNQNFKTSYHEDKEMPKVYRVLVERVKSVPLDCFFRWSRNEVPHLLVELGNGITYSICYFGRSKSWRVFWPYQTNNQQKRDFPSINNIIGFLEGDNLSANGKEY